MAMARYSSEDMERRIKELSALDRPAAYALVVEHHGKDLTRYASLILQDWQEAQDIAAETFVRALREPRFFEEEFRITAWLHRVTRNLALNARRNRTRRTGIRERFGSSQIVPPGHVGQEQYVASAQLAAGVGSLLGQLERPHEAILRLRYYEDLSYREIAQRLDVPIGTVMSRLSRARGKMRELAVAADISRNDCAAL